MTTDNQQTIGGRIRALREGKGLTVTDAARAAGLDRVNWSAIEHGRRSPTWETLAKIASALGASLGDFEMGAKQ